MVSSTGCYGSNSAVPICGPRSNFSLIIVIQKYQILSKFCSFAISDEKSYKKDRLSQKVFEYDFRTLVLRFFLLAL